MKQSEQINEIAAALAKAQGEMGKAVKSQVNGGFNSKYANLDEVIEACREALSKNGIAVVQGPGKFVDGNLKVTTELMHSSGQWIRDTITMPVPGKFKSDGTAVYDPQGAGKAITYARRYCLAAMVGIAQEDDDGNSNSYKTDKNNNLTGGFIGDNAPAGATNGAVAARKPTGGTNMPPAPNKAATGANSDNLHCGNCGETISQKVRDFSMQRFKMPLCMKCQNNAPK